MKPSLNPNQNLLDKNLTYLVAVSFGPDSMALLHWLHAQGYQLRVAHVNYHLRPESDLEQSALEQYCFQYDVPLDVLDVKNFPSGNRQDVARTIRYEFFQQLVKEYRLAGVITAHHQDDDLETAMLQEQRGKHYMYYGIRPVSTWREMTVIRPLLPLPKATLLTYCKEAKIPYAIDASNLKPIYARNRVRFALAKLSPQRRMEQLLHFQNLNQQLEKQKTILAPFVHQHNLSIQTYLGWDETSQFLYWHGAMHHRHIHIPITQTFLKKVHQVIQSKKPNHAFKLRTDPEWWVMKAYSRLYLVQSDWLKPYRFDTPKEPIDLYLLKLYPNRLKNIPTSFILRSAQPTDRIKIKDYQKTFRRLAIDWKMPLFLRSIWPVITDTKQQIIYLPRYQKNPTFQANNWLEILE